MHDITKMAVNKPYYEYIPKSTKKNKFEPQSKL